MGNATPVLVERTTTYLLITLPLTIISPSEPISAFHINWVFRGSWVKHFIAMNPCVGIDPCQLKTRNPGARALEKITSNSNVYV